MCAITPAVNITRVLDRHKQGDLHMFRRKIFGVLAGFAERVPYVSNY